MTMGRWKLNPRLLPVKAHYFLYWAGTASLWPFISVFAKQMGISEIGVGTIFGVAPVAGLISKILFGVIADHFKRKKKLFLFFILLNLVAYLCVAFLPQGETERPVKLICGFGSSEFQQHSPANSVCSDDLIESFQPKVVQEKHANVKRQRESQSLDSVNSLLRDPLEIDEIADTGYGTGNDEHRARRSYYEAGDYLEPCTAWCEIHSYGLGRNFCENLYRNIPDACNQSTSTEQDLIIRMNLRLKITAVFLTKDSGDLHLPIHEISFYNEGKPDIWGGLSCREETRLEHCFLECLNNTELNSHLETIREETELLDSMNVWLYGSLIVVGWIAMAVVASVGDALCFDTLGNRPELFGQQRQWGSIGWGAFSLIAGYLIDTSSAGKLLKDYNPCFYLVAGMLTLDLIVCYKWDIVETEKPKSLRKNVCLLLSDLRVLVFIFACILVGMCSGLLWQFLFWYVEDLSEEFATRCDWATWNKVLQGLIVAVQCFFGEVPFFHLSGYVINKLGHIHCMTLVLAAFGARFIGYSLLTNPWAVLPFELFQGVTFGLFYSTMTSYASKVSPPGTAATTQGIVGAAFEGVGVSFGSLVGGLLVQNSAGKGRTAFRLFGIAALVFSALHCILMYFLGKKTVYGLPVDTTEETDGQEMCQISESVQDGDSD